MRRFEAYRRVAVVLVLLTVAPLTPRSAGAVAVADPVPLATDCWSSDNGLPVVQSVGLGADEVDVRGGPVRVPVDVQVSDTGGPGPASGISRVSVAVGVPPAPKQSHAEFVTLDLTPVEQSTWSGTVPVPAVGSGRTWSVFKIEVTDEGVPYVALDPEGLGQAHGGAAKNGPSRGSGPSAVAHFPVDTSGSGVSLLDGGGGSSVGNDQPPPGPNPGPNPSPGPSPGPSPAPTPSPSPPPTDTEPPPTDTEPPPTDTDASRTVE